MVVGKEHEPRVFILSCQGVSSFDFKVPPGTWCYLPHERHCFYWSQLTLSCQLMNFIISFCLFYFKLVYKHKVETPGKQWQELWPILSCSLTLWHHSITFFYWMNDFLLWASFHRRAVLGDLKSWEVTLASKSPAVPGRQVRGSTLTASKIPWVRVCGNDWATMNPISELWFIEWH